LIVNPKYSVSSEKVEEWMKKMKIMMGMIMLNHMGDYMKLSKNGKIIRFYTDDSGDFYLTINHLAIPFYVNFIQKHPSFVLEVDESITDENMLYGKYKLRDHRNMLEHCETISIFLYEFLISFICDDAKKNKPLVSTHQLATFTKILVDEPLNFCSAVETLYQNSSYCTFTETSCGLFKQKVDSDSNNLYQDITKYFIDGDEIKSYMTSYH
jgi:hypothetical protein